jgi:hypothetical protein
MGGRPDRFLIALMLAGLAAASCRIASAPPASAAAPEPPVTPAASEDTLPWSAARPLRWSDYRGRPPAGRDEAAATVAGLLWGFRCVDDAFTLHMAASFFPDRSWVNPLVFVQPGANLRTLQHEQTHFDLTEVYARLTRQFFVQLRRPCDRTEDELTVMGQRFVREEFSAQRRYDEETANGRDGPAQARWDHQVHERLEVLRSFAAE